MFLTPSLAQKIAPPRNAVLFMKVKLEYAISDEVYIPPPLFPAELSQNMELDKLSKNFPTQILPPSSTALLPIKIHLLN